MIVDAKAERDRLQRENKELRNERDLLIEVCPYCSACENVAHECCCQDMGRKPEWGFPSSTNATPEPGEPTPTDPWEPTWNDVRAVREVWMTTVGWKKAWFVALRTFTARLRERVPVPRVTEKDAEEAHQAWQKHHLQGGLTPLAVFITDHLNAALEAQARSTSDD